MTEAHGVLTQTQLYATTVAVPFLDTCIGTTEYNNAARSTKADIAVSKEAACTAKQMAPLCIDGNAAMVAEATEAASQVLDQNPPSFCLMLEQGDELLVRDALPTPNCGFGSCGYPDGVVSYGTAQQRARELVALWKHGSRTLAMCEQPPSEQFDFQQYRLARIHTAHRPR